MTVGVALDQRWAGAVTFGSLVLGLALTWLGPRDGASKRRLIQLPTRLRGRDALIMVISAGAVVHGVLGLVAWFRGTGLAPDELPPGLLFLVMLYLIGGSLLAATQWRGASPTWLVHTVEIARPSLGDLTGRSVLVVDDNATNRQILARQLGSWGVSVTTAASGSIALELLCAAMRGGRPFDLAILDMRVPGTDGLMLARAIRAEPGIASVPLGLLTSLGQTGRRDEQAELGLMGMLTKPVRQSQFRGWLAAALETLVWTAGVVTEPTTPAEESSAGPTVPRILVAEDNVVNQRVVVRMLERLGYRVGVVTNGVEAVEAAARLPYAAILMDCQMPEMDGYEATAVIRAREAPIVECGGRRLPIIALTANAMAEDRERCLAAGMDEYLAKPLRPEALAMTLERCLHPTQGSTPGRGGDLGMGSASRAGLQLDRVQGCDELPRLAG